MFVPAQTFMRPRLLLLNVLLGAVAQPYFGSLSEALNAGRVVQHQTKGIFPLNPNRPNVDAGANVDALVARAGRELQRKVEGFHGGVERCPERIADGLDLVASEFVDQTPCLLKVSLANFEHPFVSHFTAKDCGPYDVGEDNR
jgi:hypothetical protein